MANPSPPLNFAWQVLSGPDLSPSQFSLTDVEDPIFTPSVAGVYVLEFEVSGASGTASDTLTVTAGDPALFTQTQRSTWRLRNGDPGWNADVDIDGNQVNDVRDLIMAMAGVYCL